MSAQYAPGTLIWARHEQEVWVPAEIISCSDREVVAKIEGGGGESEVITFLAGEQLCLRSDETLTHSSGSAVDDLTRLTHLHEPAVLSALQLRFEGDCIYTLTGPILIALNPFKQIRGLYEDRVLHGFLDRAKPSVAPHVFNTACAAYRGICDRQTSQTVLISGESGAGKTENTKLAMKFLAIAGSAGGEVLRVERQVLESNPLLEAFGNARTLRNDNSSRFGKFIELQFQSLGRDPQASVRAGVPGVNCRLCGARIQTYLLEKVRVGDQQEGERNYHVFYEACAASVSKVKNAVPEGVSLEGFAEVSRFAYLTRSSCRALKDVDDVDMFSRRIQAMQTIGIAPEDVNNVLRCVAAVLHLGNMKFAAMENSDGSYVTSDSEDAVASVCHLTCVGRAQLEKALCSTTRITRGERICSPVGVRQASDNRDALARALYGLVFNFIVKMTNLSIGYDDSVKLFIGVLDIFGFECFKVNSFEQLCINFTNERLQQFFNQFVFKLEEQLYESEGIPWDPLDFPDNQDAVDLLQMRGSGIFALLDEECVVPAGSDQGFCNKLVRTHRGHRRLEELRTKAAWFVVNHFAGPVAYCTDSFLEKNRDQLSNDIIECMGASGNPFVISLFRGDSKFSEVLLSGSDPGNPEKGQQLQKRQRKYTVSSEFKDQLSSLMEIVDTTEPHFIRCIKPNALNVPDHYDRRSVTEQLRYGGVLQVVQVSRAGYPVRISFRECWDDFRLLLEREMLSVLNSSEAAGDHQLRTQALLDHLSERFQLQQKGSAASWAVGRTMVFFKLAAFERLKYERLELLIRSATKVQAACRRCLCQRRYGLALACARHLQALLRSRSARMELLFRRRTAAATRLQAQGRCYVARRQRQRSLAAAGRMQRCWRGAVGRRAATAARRLRAGVRIQRRWRHRRERKVAAILDSAHVVARQRWDLQFCEQQVSKLKRNVQEVTKLTGEVQHACLEKTVERDAPHKLEALWRELKDKIKAVEDSVAEAQRGFEDAKKICEVASKLTTSTMRLVGSGSEGLVAMRKRTADGYIALTKLKVEFANVREGFSRLTESHASLRSFFDNFLQHRASRLAALDFLVPSLQFATKDMEEAKRKASITSNYWPVQEFRPSVAGVTCVCFSSENQPASEEADAGCAMSDSTLLAVACCDGAVVVYQCRKTPLEAAWSQGLPPQGNKQEEQESLACSSGIREQRRLPGHSRAVTAMAFSPRCRGELVTGSMDKSVRIWDVDSGLQLRAFTYSTAVTATAFPPSGIDSVVVADAASALRLLNIKNGTMVQEISSCGEIRAMAFDSEGPLMFCGSRDGSLAALEVSESGFGEGPLAKLSLTRSCITDVVVAPSVGERVMCLLVNTLGSAVCVVGCNFPGGKAVELVPKYRVHVPQKSLPLRSCFSPCGSSGHLVSGSEDGTIRIVSLSGSDAGSKQSSALRYHRSPVLAVSISSQATLLASADATGHLALWRRLRSSGDAPRKALLSVMPPLATRAPAPTVEAAPAPVQQQMSAGGSPGGDRGKDDGKFASLKVPH